MKLHGPITLSVMDPLSAVSLFCNILDLADKAIKAVTLFQELYVSLDGRSERDTALLNFTSQLKEILDSLPVSHAAAGSTADSTNVLLSTVTRKCKQLASEILQIIDYCKVRKSRHCLAALRALGFAILNKRKLDDRVREMKACRDELNFLMVKITQ